MSHRSIPISVSCVLLLAMVVPIQTAAQDYAMYETQYLTVLPGHSDAFNDAITSHNQRFHSAGPYTAAVYFILNGPYSSQISWVMGPSTWTQLDGRPSGDPHDSDWAQGVLSHAVAGLTEYWRRDDDLSTPPDPNAAPKPILRVRFFEVADNDLFVETQEQIEATFRALGDTRARTFYRKQFRHRDGRDWALVTSHDNWAELDQPGSGAGGAFQRTFVELHGVDAWADFLDARDEAVIGVEDEWRQRIP